MTAIYRCQPIEHTSAVNFSRWRQHWKKKIALAIERKSWRETEKVQLVRYLLLIFYEWASLTARTVEFFFSLFYLFFRQSNHDFSSGIWRSHFDKTFKHVYYIFMHTWSIVYIPNMTRIISIFYITQGFAHIYIYPRCMIGKYLRIGTRWEWCWRNRKIWLSSLLLPYWRIVKTIKKSCTTISD